jgi:hypothetical protein
VLLTQMLQWVTLLIYFNDILFRLKAYQIY